MKIIIKFLLIVCLPITLLGQTKFQKKFNATFSNNGVDNNLNLVKNLSQDGNVLKFMELGYFINANNILLEKSYNDIVINNIIAKGKNNLGSDYRWLVSDVTPSGNNFSMKGREFVLYEGYLFRYVAQYQYLNPINNLSDPNFVKSNFMKWYYRSFKEYGDLSSLYGIRFHMGSHWATVAAYLSKQDSKNKDLYHQFLSEYNRQLRKALKIKIVNGNECYVWAATYPEKFTAALRKRTTEYVIQDVSHGNHIVQYVIDSYNLGIGGWSEKDLTRFANTLKHIIWKNRLRPADNVDGSYSGKKGTKGMGWKQSDGWMKLMTALNDRTLYLIYDNFFNHKPDKVSKFYPNLQYFANMALFEINNDL